MPSVLIPYVGPCGKTECQDVFVYLRPETNGVEVESILLRVIHGNSDYQDRLKLVYLANIPGDFIVARKIIEKHYSLQLCFASNGKKAFTLHMRREFEKFFHTSFESADIIGSFEALNRLHMDFDDLFNLRVPRGDMLKINGQSVKKYMDCFIVNYDIPAILHKNNNETDIAVMIFRTDLEYNMIRRVIDDMGEALIENEILHPGKPLSRIFHYSKGPFDQVRDAIGYLYTKDIKHVDLKRIAFSHFLIERGISMHRIVETLKNPLMVFHDDRLGDIECDLFTYTMEDTYTEAYEKFMKGKSLQIQC